MEWDFFFNICATIVTIILSIIAIGIAIRSSRQTSKDTALQIQNLKQLILLQIDAQLVRLEIEIFKTEVMGINTNDEISKAKSDFEKLRSDPNTNDKQIAEFQNKIQYLSKNADIHKAWWLKLFNTQASLVFKSQKIKREETLF